MHRTIDPLDRYLYSPLLLLTALLSAAAAETAAPYTPTDLILLNCGSSSNETSPDGRRWDGDASSKLAAAGTQNSSSSVASTASNQDPSVPEVPFSTARIFLSDFTYAFPVSAGPKFLRLYFHPETYSGNDPRLSYFSVIANNYTLLRNFSAFLAAEATEPPVAWFVREFVVDGDDDQKLTVTFSPAKGSYGFVNGIEVVSMPDDLYLRGQDHGYTTVGSDSLFYIPNSTSLETVYRLNVGGSDVSPQNDAGMFRIWKQDQIYAFTLGTIPNASRTEIRYTAETPPYTAPEIVYQTSRILGGDSEGVRLNSNLTWILPVDSGFNYLVRLHFCETQDWITKPNQRLFYVFINNQTADPEADVILMSGGNGVPVYEDFVVFVAGDGDGSEGREDLWIALHPNADRPVKPEAYDVILNGAEVFKLNHSDGSLAGANPEFDTVTPPATISPEKRRGKKSVAKVLVMAVTFGSVFVISFLFCFFLIWRRKRATDSGSSKAKSSWVPFSVKSSSTTVSSLPSDLCRRFSIVEIKTATNDFDDAHVLGSGGFGKVYRGSIDVDGAPAAVAIKRSNPASRQGVCEFETEIKMLSKLRHVHLVALIGYCDDRGEMILVYEYMPRGTLRDHLYRTQNDPVAWRRRLEICIGAARGLHYLHTGAKHVIIHRDVKSTNILLDENWVAKVSDFGLSRVGPTAESETHVSTVVKGSIGYVDPEYCRRQQLTEKSDVYSFGVVLFEVLCARPAMVMGIQKERVSLALWGSRCARSGTLDQIVDPNLSGQIAPECLRKFGEVAERCVDDNGIKRPTMGDVVWALEFALQLQESAEKRSVNGGDGFDRLGASPLSTFGGINDREDMFSGTSGHKSGSRSNTTLNFSSEDSSSLLKSANVFSEIMDPTAR